MGRLAYALALLAIAVSAAVIVTTSADLPPMVASHFAAGGRASGSMPRDDYRLLMLALAVLMPATIMLSLAALPRVAPALVNVPNARVWLTPPHRETTLASLAARGAIAGILLTVFICAVHLLVVRANALTPAHIDADALGGVVGAFMLAIAAWAVALIVRFRKPPT
jgi:hypothetical protein